LDEVPVMLVKLAGKEGKTGQVNSVSRSTWTWRERSHRNWNILLWV